MIDLILKVSNASFSCRDMNKKNRLSIVDVMVLLLRKSSSLTGCKSSEMQFFMISTFSTTNSYLRLKLSVKGNKFTIKMYN